MTTAAATRPCVSIGLSTLPSSPSSSAPPQVRRPGPSTGTHPILTPTQLSIDSAERTPYRAIKQFYPKVAATILFVTAVLGIGVIVWTKQSLDVSYKSLSLAQWTAKKDFLE